MTLKRSLEDPRSPLRGVLAYLLPDLVPVMRPAWHRQVRGAAPLAPPPDAPADALGHAIGALVAWRRAPLLSLGTPLPAVERLIRRGASEDLFAELHSSVSAPALGAEHEARVAYLFGLLDQVYRSGRVDMVGHKPLLKGKSVRDAAALVPREWITDVAAVADHAEPAMSALAGGVIVAPTFMGSVLVGGADGDLAIGPSLVEVKATARPEGRATHFLQVCSYALLDFEDEHEIKELVLAPVRFGTVARWSLEETIEKASAQSLAGVRAQVRHFLERAKPYEETLTTSAMVRPAGDGWGPPLSESNHAIWRRPLDYSEAASVKQVLAGS